MNMLLKLGLVAGAVFGVSKLFAAVKAKRVSDELNINLVNPRVHKFDPNPLTGGVEVRTEVKLQNPTKGKLNLTQPFVQILSKGTPIASSNVQNQKFTIEPLSELMLNTISLKVSWATIISQLTSVNYNFPANSNLIQKITWIISNYQSIISKMNLSIKYSTYANGLFYTSTEKI